MTEASNCIVQQLWSCCNVLRANDLRSALGQIEDILGDMERRLTNDKTARGA